MDRPVLRDAAVLIEAGRIVAVDSLQALRAVCGRTEVIELPKSILLPGLVNAHVHLELSNCECGEALQGTFADWILGIREKMRIDPENVEASVSAAVKNGISQ